MVVDEHSRARGQPNVHSSQTVFKNADGKWDAKYSIVAAKDGESLEIALEHGGSGDEGYEEYRVVEKVEGIPLTSGAISNRFEWASFEGDLPGDIQVNYDCRK